VIKIKNNKMKANKYFNKNIHHKNHSNNKMKHNIELKIYHLVNKLITIIRINNKY